VCAAVANAKNVAKVIAAAKSARRRKKKSETKIITSDYKRSFSG